MPRSMTSTIVLTAGASYTGPFTLPVKSGTLPVTITTSATLPNRRITPADAALLPKLIVTNAERAIQTVAGAHDYNLVGLEVLPKDSTITVYALIELGGTSNQTSLAQQPQRLTLDRMYIHGLSNADNQRGIGLNSGETSIINCYISDIHGVGFDTQTIGGWNGSGPYHIINNYLEAAGENVMFGGALAYIPNLVPSNIEFRDNDVVKPQSWNFWSPQFVSPFGQAVTWTTSLKPGLDEDQSQTWPAPRWVDARGNIAKHWSVKNSFELKNAANVTIDHNVFDGSWGDAQVGYALLFTVRSEAGQMPWATIKNVRVTNNVIRNTEQGVQTLGIDYMGANHPQANRVYTLPTMCSMFRTGFLW